MVLRRGRFRNFSRQDALRVLEKLEGPLQELLLAQNSSDVSSADVPAEVLPCDREAPRLEALHEVRGSTLVFSCCDDNGLRNL